MITGSPERVWKAFGHEQPDRTPLFEIFQTYHPIHWPICGRTIGSDAAMAWDAMSEGVAWEELFEAEAQAQFQVCRHFELDMVRLNGGTPRNYVRPEKLGVNRWRRNGIEYALNERIAMVEVANPGEELADSHRISEDDVRREVEAWDGSPGLDGDDFPMHRRVRELAEADGIKWVYMGEIGAGTGAAFYPPFLLMWMLLEPEMYQRWLEMTKIPSFRRTEGMIRAGMEVIAMGGDVSCDKGPFISPDLYREFILPVIQEHIGIIHRTGARAVYTSDGNHWAIQQEMFFDSGADGYKEVDKAAGMTMERLIEAGIDRQLCIIGNIDARHTLCHGTPKEVEQEVVTCLRLGQVSPGGHILHNSHSVHEDVKAGNYRAGVNAYRRYFGMPQLPK